MMRLACLFVLAGIPLHAQAPHYQFTFAAPGSLFGNTGAPYSADEVQQRARPDAGGKLVADAPQMRRKYRDSEGRTRVDTPVPRSNMWVAEIEDPVAGYKFVLDPQARVAHRIKVASNRTSPIVVRSAPLKPAGSDQALGTRVIEGFQAVGTRTVVKLQTGSSNIDRWVIPELSVLVLLEDSLPKSGRFTTRLEHISRAEPDAALFQVPAGYTVVDEKGAFTITITVP